MKRKSFSPPSDARLWRGREGVTEPAVYDELADRKTFLEEALSARGECQSALERGIESLSKAISSTDGPGIKDGLDSLIGLGEGLTPAGDDILLGILCLFRSIPRETRSDRLSFFLESFTERIGGYLDSTTFAGYSFLRYGSEGRFCEPLSDLCNTILSNGNGGPNGGRELEKSMAGLLDVGATSGLNMLMGVVLGVDLYMEDMEKRLKVSS